MGGKKVRQSRESGVEILAFFRSGCRWDRVGYDRMKVC